MARSRSLVWKTFYLVLPSFFFKDTVPFSSLKDIVTQFCLVEPSFPQFSLVFLESQVKGGASTEVRPTTEFFYRVFQGQMRLWLLLLFNCPLPVQGVGGWGQVLPSGGRRRHFQFLGLINYSTKSKTPKKKMTQKKTFEHESHRKGQTRPFCRCFPSFFFGFLPSFFSVLVLIETADLLLYSSIRFFF